MAARRVIGSHPDVAFLNEPRHVWVWGNAYRRDDVLTAKDARPLVKRHIRRVFSNFLERSGKPRLLEKTPSNCLRLPFIQQVFPDARFVHIFRDGRAVLRSTRKMQSAQPAGHWVVKRIAGTPPWEWPALAPRFWRTFGARALGRPMRYWGPCPPGWRRWVEDDPRHVILAKQWVGSVEATLEFRDTAQPEHWLDIRYEDLVADPIVQLRRVLAFADLREDPDHLERVRQVVDPTRQAKWRTEVEDSVLEDTRSVFEPVLGRLGYDW